MTCQWPIDRSCWPELCSEIDKQRMQQAADMAVFVLWSLTGRQFGICPVLARPCPLPCTEFDPAALYPSIDGTLLPGPGWYPIWDNGGWRNISCGCGARCTRTGPTVVHLAGPVVSVDTVTIDGVPLDPRGWVLEGDYLYRAGGAQWPRQDLRAPLGESGTWSVEYQQGYAPPAGAGTHVGQLALEFFNACAGGKCRLPKRVQQITRQGVSMQMIDPNDLFGAGLTGIDSIDLWIRAVNPARLSAAPRVR
ncbi:hypothetical protein [Nocardia otitidiscaviarum]|uniref:hypothetical protein n=1 Tax=Nocardia otitidiscaviarum TaxID=1823 RepID=UPI0004A6B5AD|nr:hypothetical protein [Nocardia otitidiscaviarum]